MPTSDLKIYYGYSRETSRALRTALFPQKLAFSPPHNFLTLSANDPSTDPALNNSGASNAAQAAHGAKPGVQVLDSETANKLEEPLSESPFTTLLLLFELKDY